MNDKWAEKHKEIHDTFTRKPRDLERSGVHLRTFEKVSGLFEHVIEEQGEAHNVLAKSLSEMRFERNVWLYWSFVLLLLNVFQFSMGC